MTKFALPLSTLLLGASFAQAAVVFENNFNSYTAGAVLTRASTGANVFHNQSGTADNGTDYFTRVTQDSGNVFGGGTSNNYLRFADTSNTNAAEIARLSTGTNRFSTEVGTLSFDFLIPSGGQSTGWSIFLGNGNPGSSNIVFGINLRLNGNIVTTTAAGSPSTTILSPYTPNTAQKLAIVFNSSISTVTYAGGSLATGTMDIWLGNTRIGTGIAATGGKGANWTGLTPVAINNVNIASNFASANTAQDFRGEILIDNFVIDNTAISPIPEPASMAILGGLGALAAAGFGRARRRRD